MVECASICPVTPLCDQGQSRKNCPGTVVLSQLFLSGHTLTAPVRNGTWVLTLCNIICNYGRIQHKLQLQTVAPAWPRNHDFWFIYPRHNVVPGSPLVIACALPPVVFAPYQADLSGRVFCPDLWSSTEPVNKSMQVPITSMEGYCQRSNLWRLSQVQEKIWWDGAFPTGKLAVLIIQLAQKTFGGHLV